jgi:hypothetical protein
MQRGGGPFFNRIGILDIVAFQMFKFHQPSPDIYQTEN